MEAESNTTSQAKKAFWISITLGVIATLGIVFVVYQVLNSGSFAAWQGTIAISIFVILAICAWSSAILSRRQHTQTGVRLMIISLLIFMLSVPTFITNRGTVIAVMAFFLIMGITLQTLSEKRSNQWIAIAAVSGIIAILTDLFIPVERAETTFTPLPVVAMGIVSIIFLVALLLRYRKLHVRTKLLVAFITIPSVIVLLVGSFFLYSFLGRLNVQIDQLTIEDALTQKDKVTSFLTTVSSDIQFLEHSVTLQTYLDLLNSDADPEDIAAAKKAVSQEFHAFAQAHPIYDQIRFIDDSGQEIVRVSINAQGNPTIVPEEALQNKAGRYYFDDTLALDEGELMISPLDLNVEHGAIETPHKPVIRYGTPIIVDGEKKGVIVTNVLADNFLTLLENDTVSNYLVDADGYYLYHPDEEKRWGRDLGTGFTIMQDEPKLAGPLFSNQVDTYDDNVTHYAFTPVVIPGEESPRWYLLNAIPTKVAFASVSETLTISMAVLAISLMVLSLLALLVSKTFTSPMAKLTAAAREISRGNLDANVQLKNEDEFGLLAETFNQMAFRLNDLFNNMETQVQERTQGLELAAEVSRSLSQVHDPYLLLDTAVELIRSRFDLYYTQIYLLNESRQMLMLRAGTGEVGIQLLQRGHTLPTGPGSINGMAVSEKQAIIIPDTSQDMLFRANPLLPRTRSEMSVPMIIGERVVGVLDLQSAEANALTPENLLAFETLASQIAIALENVTLLTEAVESRAEIENYSRQITRGGWDDYLNGIQHPQTIGYEFDLQTDIEPNKETSPTTWDTALNIPITVADQPIGTIQIEADEGQHLTQEDVSLLQSIATEVGQQVENLRLLDNATRYQIEAERAIRRLTHEGWAVYEESADLANGFVYDQTEVKPATAVLEENALAADLIQHPLSLRSEEVGEILLAKPDNMDDAFTGELVTSVAATLTTHMESLRLNEQTEKALAESQQRSRILSAINSVAEATVSLTNINDLLETVRLQLTQVIPVNSFTVATYNKAENSLYYEYGYDDKYGKLDNSSPFPLEPHHLSYKSIMEAVPQIIHYTPEEVDEQTRNRPPSMIDEDSTLTASLLFVPQLSGEDIVGIISVQSYQFNAYTQDDVNLLISVGSYVTTALQKARLFEQTQTRAEELAVINQVAQTVSQQIDQHDLLMTVYEQIRRILPVDAYLVALYDHQNNLLDYPLIYDDGHFYQNPPSTPSPTNKMLETIRTGQPILINRSVEEMEAFAKTHPNTMVGNKQKISASLAYVPLRIGEETLGTLSIQSYRLNAYTEANITLLSGIANHVAVALDNARLLQTTQNTARREQLLREISTNIQSTVDAESVLQTAAREIGRALGLNTFVYLTDPEQTTNESANGGNGHHD